MHVSGVCDALGVLVCVCEGEHMYVSVCMCKATWGGKGLFGLHFHIAVHRQRKSGQELKQGRSLEAGADAEAMGWDAAYWLALHGLLRLLSYRTWDHQPRDRTTDHGLGPLPSITK